MHSTGIKSEFHLENFPWGGSSLDSSCYVSYTWCIASFSVVPSLACGAVTSLACHESAFVYNLILVVISLGGKLHVNCSTHTYL